MSTPIAVFASRRLQAPAAALLCLAAVQLASALAEAGPSPSPPSAFAVRGVLRR